MPTITTVDATWDTGVTLDAAELRRADSAMFLGDGTSNGVRGGIVYHGPGSLAVSVNGSDQVTVQAGAFVVPAATGLGVYRGALSATTPAVAVSPRNATNPRIDLIVIQATGSGATVKTVDGTPGASPSAPALPAQHIELARLTVPAVGGGAIAVDSTWRAYAAALGGTLYVETSARLPGFGNVKGQRAVALDTGTESLWNGSAWDAAGRSVVIPSANGNFTNSSTAKVDRRTVTLHLLMTSVITVGGNADAAAVPAGVPLPAADAFGAGIDNGSGSHVDVYVTTSGIVRHVLGRTAGQVTKATITYVS